MSEEENITLYGRIPNDRNDCYSCSILVCLEHIKPLTQYILSNKKKDKKLYTIIRKIIKAGQKHKVIIDIEIIKEFKQIISKMDDRWEGHMQQDSAEFLTFLIARLQEECGIEVSKVDDFIEFDMTNELVVKARNDTDSFHKKEDSTIFTLFNSMTHNIKQCVNCNYQHHKFDWITMLQLQIIDETNTLEECIDNYMKQEELDWDNKLTCDKCKQKTKGLSSISFWKFSDIIVIQFKRFLQDDFGRPNGKNTKNIDYPLEFDFDKYVHCDSPYKKSGIYKLYAVNIHVGSLRGGHYYSFVNNNDTWYIYNDDNKIKKFIDIKGVQDNDAYLLFYVKE